MRIAVIHPDLGIGGAERLVVDSALALQNNQHKVKVYTMHHDKAHCFEETKDGRVQVQVLGSWPIPRHIFGKLAILCVSLRQLQLILQLYLCRVDADVFFVDQLSAGIPLIKTLFPSSRVIFYCHYPDLLLASRESLLRRAYRAPFDYVEKITTAASDAIVVNSQFTRGVYQRTFGNDMPVPSVVYPCVGAAQVESHGHKLIRGRYFVSVNRFERKKNIELAIESFALLLHAHTNARGSSLVICGGYDERVTENVMYLAELRQMAEKLRLPSMILFAEDEVRLDDTVRVVFMPSVKTSVRERLTAEASALVYTPENEHFGIVPLEAMRLGTPVLATNTGGPLETVVDGETGWLRPAVVEEWYKVMKFVILEASERELARMGRAGVLRAKQFSLERLGEDLERVVVGTSTKEGAARNSAALVFRAFLCCLVGILLTFLGAGQLWDMIA